MLSISGAAAGLGRDRPDRWPLEDDRDASTALFTLCKRRSIMNATIKMMTRIPTAPAMIPSS